MWRYRQCVETIQEGPKLTTTESKASTIETSYIIVVHSFKVIKEQKATACESRDTSIWLRQSPAQQTLYTCTNYMFNI